MADKNPTARHGLVAHRVGDAHDTGEHYVALERWARELSLIHI